MKWLNGRLVSRSHSNVASGMSATRVSCNATASYPQRSRFISVPSPNQAPSLAADKNEAWPSELVTDCATSPLMMPTQNCATDDAHTTAPRFGTIRSLVESRTRSRSSRSSILPQDELLTKAVAVSLWDLLMSHGHDVRGRAGPKGKAGGLHPERCSIGWQ